MMNAKQLIACAGLITGGLLTLGNNPAYAFGFSFTSECLDPVTGERSAAVCGRQAPDRDIILDLVEYINPNTGLTERRSDLTLVDQAQILRNKTWNGGNSGGASADQGINSTIGLSKENITAEDIANDDPDRPSVLTNYNLNSIVDTEDKADIVINLMFETAVDNILVWERGINSRLELQAIDANGEIVVGSNSVFLGNRANGGVRRDFTPWDYAGYEITTKEIANTSNPSQKVGSRGVSKTDFGLDLNAHITGVRLISNGRKWYNGPDWKVMGTIDAQYPSPQTVPEPFAMAGLALVGGAIATRRSRFE